MMKIVVSNTSPLRYLTGISEQDLLPQLFGKILIPKAVYRELIHKNTPTVVREYFLSRPTWIEVCEVKIASDNSALLHLDAGEIEAILLAKQKNANLLLIDEKKGRLTAKEECLPVIGIVGVLQLAHRQQKVDLPEIVDKLLKTNIKISPSLLESLLKGIQP
jgi:predicted nucleic acid-binding protein